MHTLAQIRHLGAICTAPLYLEHGWHPPKAPIEALPVVRQRRPGVGVYAARPVLVPDRGAPQIGDAEYFAAGCRRPYY